ncbi:FND11 protein, partial [Polyodon spathula]|nr:FND11 protein [Polyodon spathula]
MSSHNEWTRLQPLTKNSFISKRNGQLGEPWKKYTEQKNSIVGFIGSQLSSAALRRYKVRVDIMKKCSHYMDVMWKDLSFGDQNYMTTSTMFHLIDPWKFQQMKKIGTTQIKIKLHLLEEFYKEIKHGKEQLETILRTYDMATFSSEWESIQERLVHVTKVLSDFNSVLMPGKLHTKHRLISDMGHTKIPHIRLAVNVKMPVVFDKKESHSSQKSAMLTWYIEGQSTLHPPEQFEVRYKLITPTTLEEGSQFGTISVSSFSIEIGNLLPEKSYEFTIKRAETYCLIYGFWNDTIVLKTKPSPTDHVDYFQNASCCFV